MPNYWLYELAPPVSRPGSASVSAVNTSGSAAGSAGYYGVVWNGIPPSPPDPLIPGGNIRGMNDGGDVVGELDSSDGAFLHRNGGQTEDLALILAGVYIRPWDISNDGVVVGDVGTPSGMRGFVYDSIGGSVNVLDPFPGDISSTSSGINDHGHAVGLSLASDYGPANLYINRNNQIDSLGLVHWSTVVRMNNGDVITGWKLFRGAKAPTAFRLDAAVNPPVFEDIGHSPRPGTHGSYGNGINDDGVVVGHSFGPGGVRAFVDIPASGGTHEWYDLDENVIANADGWDLTIATGISNTGYIVGIGTYQGEHRSFLLAPAPDDPYARLAQQMKQRLGDFATEFTMLLGGVEKGGSGYGILPSGRPIPIPPHEWKHLSPAEQDVMVGLAIRNLSLLLDSPERRQILERAGIDVVNSALAELRRARANPDVAGER